VIQYPCWQGKVHIRLLGIINTSAKAKDIKTKAIKKQHTQRMRLTAELFLRNEVEQRTNPLRQRELCLRGYGIAVLENLGAIPGLQQLDCWDLSHNRLARLENFPETLTRLVNLQCADNAIETIDIANLCSKVPNLTMLNLSFNRIAQLQVVASLKACRKLEFLLLNGNPVATKLQKSADNSAQNSRQEDYYRLFTIYNIPSLKVLDYVKIKPAERTKAERFAKSSAGRAYFSAALAGAAGAQNINGDTGESLLETDGTTTVKTFVPGEGLLINGEHDDEFGPLLVPETETAAHGAATASNGKTAVAFTDEQKQAIRQLLANAVSVKEMEAIESAVKRGILPPAAAAMLLQQQQQEQQATATPKEDETDATSTTGKRKGPDAGVDDAAANGDAENTATTKNVQEEEEEEPPQKQQKVA
jgi:U2 small nuclear ribonucleoprotein A'